MELVENLIRVVIALISSCSVSYLWRSQHVVMLWLACVLVASLTAVVLWRSKNPAPLCGVYQQEGKWYTLKYITFLAIYHLRKVSTSHVLDPAPLCGVYQQEGKWYTLKYIMFMAIYHLRKVSTSHVLDPSPLYVNSSY